MKWLHLKDICILNCVVSAGCSPIRVFKKGNLLPENDILVRQQYQDWVEFEINILKGE
ncbi:MAG: hypothetical protein R2568_10130 [Candidatus Scalindua sp.]|nr:hypothetical protein [Candidatus Scalindua sp.]MDV5167087.1 hypothetical protein [Candidatus Scalindua sp.]